jgi:hypothetical protein
MTKLVSLLPPLLLPLPAGNKCITFSHFQERDYLKRIKKLSLYDSEQI